MAVATGTALLIAGGLAAGAGVASGVMQSSVAESAAETMAGATDVASATQWAMYNQSREDLAPWRQAGTEALGTLQNMLTAGPGEFVPEDQPGYQFGYEEFVEEPTLRMASATGSLGGGGTQKALTRYAQDYASQQYDNFLTRWYKSLTPYQSLAGIGQTTAVQGAQTGAYTGAQIGQNILAGGEARATGYINQGNIWGNVASGIGQNALDYAAMRRNPSAVAVNPNNLEMYGSPY